MGPHVTQQGLQLEVDLPMTSQLAPNHLASPVLLAVIPSRNESVDHGSNTPSLKEMEKAKKKIPKKAPPGESDHDVTGNKNLKKKNIPE